MPGLGRSPWKRERLPTPIFQSGEFHGLYSPRGCKESVITERLSLHFTQEILLVRSEQSLFPQNIYLFCLYSFKNLFIYLLLAVLGRCYCMGFPSSSDGKASACGAGDPGLIPGLGRSPGEGNGNPLQYSCLESAMDRGAWWATVHGSQRVRHN